MLPKSVKIKRSLSQPGQEPRWKRAKGNEDTPCLRSVATEPLGAKRQVVLGPFCAFVQNSLGVIFLLCCKRDGSASLLLLLGFPSNGKTQPPSGSYVLAPICPCPLPIFLASLLEKKSNFCHLAETRELGFYSRYFLTLTRREGGICNHNNSQLSPAQEISLSHPQLFSQRRV